MPHYAAIDRNASNCISVYLSGLYPFCELSAAVRYQDHKLVLFFGLREGSLYVPSDVLQKAFREEKFYLPLPIALTTVLPQERQPCTVA